MGWKDVTSNLRTYLSHTQISMFQRCPKQYEFRYVQGLKVPPDSRLILGTSVHRGVEFNYAHKFKTRKPAKRDAVMDAFSDAFKREKSGVDFQGVNPGTVKDLGYDMLGKHYDKLAPAVQPLMEPELEFEFKVPGLKRKVVGFIDVVAKVLSIPLAVLDNKTTRRSYKQWDADISGQLTSYAYAVHSLVKKIPVLGFDVLTDKKSGVTADRYLTSRTADQLKRFENTAQLIEKSIDAGIFVPTDDPQTCSWCGYNARCFARAAKARNLTRAQA